MVYLISQILMKIGIAFMGLIVVAAIYQFIKHLNDP